MRTSFFIVLLVLFTMFKPLFAQDTDTIAKPKIGLALSGGAAKGLAHIGVLKVLEEIGITPDYITGTSMGAIVGSLYAMGYSADEISDLNSEADWEELLSDRIPLSEVVFEEKYEYNRYIFGFPIRNYKFKLPSGVIEGQQLEKFFADLMWPLSEVESFDSLPIPFHCMAVDLISGKTIEFNSGNLSESIRASMSIPSIFAPESIDTMLLVDGGMIRNFPVAEVKKMGADLVIGVYVGSDEKVSKEDLFSLSDVLSRATVFYGIFDSNQQMKMTDVLIEPNLQGLGATDFAKAKRIEIFGEVAALEIQQELYCLVDSLDLECKPAKRLDRPEKIYIKEIEVINERSFVSDKFIIGRSGVKLGTYVSKEDLSEAVDKIFGTQYFKKVTYSVLDFKDGTYKLIFKVKESTRAFLNLAAHYDNQYGPGIITNLTLRNYLAPASRAIVSLNVAENPGARIDINKYIGKNQHIINNYFFNWDHNTNSLYYDGIDIGSYQMGSMNVGLGGRYSISLNQQIGVMGIYEINRIAPNDNLRDFYQVESFDRYIYKGFAYKLYYNLNTTDDNFFPHEGVKLDVYYKCNLKPKINYDINQDDKISLNEVGFLSTDQDEFYSFSVNFDKYTTFFEKLTFDVGASFGISSNESIIIGSYVLGGYHWDQRSSYVPFAGMNFAEFVVPNYGLIKTGIDLQIIPKIYITARANIGFYTQSKDDFVKYIQTSPLKSYMKGYSVGLRANTVIGPVNVMYGDNDYDGNIRWYISIGYPF